MRWVLTGGWGMLGRELHQTLTAAGHDVTALGHRDCDISQLADVQGAVRGADVVVNTAAWTDVDTAETHEAQAWAVNAIGARNVAVAARQVGARLVHISTDYVFDGKATAPYPTDAPTNPCQAYGRTKLAGEWAVQHCHPDALVVRTAWLYGGAGANFVTSILQAGRRGPVRVVADKTGQPTWTQDLAHAIEQAISRGLPGGTYHGTNAGHASRYDLALEAFTLAGLDPTLLIPTTSDDDPRPAARPTFSALAHDGSVFSLPPWRESLAHYLAQG